MRHFFFRKADADAITLLAILAIGFFGTVIYMGQRDDGPATEGCGADSLAASRPANERQTQRPAIIYNQGEEQRAERFPFDPNTADSTTLLRLGLQPWQVANIYRYRSHGGIYRRPEDFARLYGLTQKQYRELEPYIRISADYRPAAELVKDRPAERDTMRFPAKLKEQERIVLNTADTNALKRIPGIGSYYARQIVRYGQRLGGYVSTDQLDEIEDLPPEAKQYLVISHPAPQKLNINRLTLQQLKRHPYIGYFRAKTITDYRRQHGPIHSLDELRLDRDFTEADIRRLQPYIEY